MSKEAMKLALEALELNNSEWKYLADSGDSGYWKAEDQGHYQLTNEAITALREALTSVPDWASEAKEQQASATELREQEPVAWRTYTGRGYYIIDATLEEAQRNWPDKQHQPLYTSPPTLSLAQRQARSADTWVGLTLEDMETTHWSPDFRAGAKWAAAKLKEKNGG